MRQSDAIVKRETRGRLIVKLIYPLENLFPIGLAARGELDNARAFVDVRRHALNKPIPFQALEDTVQVLPGDNEIFAEIAQRNACGELRLREGAENGPLHRAYAKLLNGLALQLVSQLEQAKEDAVVELIKAWLSSGIGLT